MLEQQSITIPLGNIYGLQWQASYCICRPTCIVCVLQDSQVDQHFADGTFPALTISRNGTDRNGPEHLTI